MDAIVVYDIDKLPANIQQLLNPEQPLPAGAQFFEERYALADLMKQFFWGAVLPVLGLALLVVSGFVFWHLDRYSSSYDRMTAFLGGMDVVALVMIAIGYMMLSALRAKYRMVRRQQQGLPTRYGILIVDDMLIYNGDVAIKVVPKAVFKGLKDRQLDFEHEGQTKSLDIPTALVRQDMQVLDAAVAAWAA